jgi:hypothetical protein
MRAHQGMAEENQKSEIAIENKCSAGAGSYAAGIV